MSNVIPIEYGAALEKIKKGDNGMFTKENVRNLIPNFYERMTREEFEKNFNMPNKDADFSKMLKRYSDLPDVSEQIAALSIDKE